MSQISVLATWPFGQTAVRAALPLLRQGLPALDAAIAGAQEEGVIVIDCGPENNVIRFIPPLNVTDEELDLALTGLERAIERAAAR